PRTWCSTRVISVAREPMTPFSAWLVKGPPRPRLALAIDGGPPVRLASGSDLSIGPAADPGAIELRLSESATRRLLPFLRRGKTLSASVSGEGGDQIAVELSLAGFGPAAAEMDSQQGRAERQDALTALIGSGAIIESGRRWSWIW
ncbi:hypothetical protein ACIKTA_10660, partial [Hansschlegelia beijingensis]